VDQLPDDLNDWKKETFVECKRILQNPHKRGHEVAVAEQQKHSSLITAEQIIDLQILINTSMDVEDFIKQI